MADKHPYTSVSGGLVQAVTQLRKAFPPQVSADTLKKLGIAPNNESYVINILRFIRVIDKEGKRTTEVGRVFSKHDDSEFQNEFAKLVKAAYADLFGRYGDATWNLSSGRLISFFRSADQTSAIVGQRQAATFQTLSVLAGHIDVPSPNPRRAAKKSTSRRASSGQATDRIEPAAIAEQHQAQPPGTRDVGLAVRIEVNLPLATDQETYDRIFKSIRENLLNG